MINRLAIPFRQNTPVRELPVYNQNIARGLLNIQSLTMTFAGLKALSDVSFVVPSGSIVGLIGPNGAGKTTLLNCISRIYKPQSGFININGNDLCRVPLHRVAEHGIARTFQNLEVYSSATVLENVAINCMWSQRTSLMSELLALSGARRKQHDVLGLAMASLDKFGLSKYAHQRIDSLSFGTQKNVELARAMASKPTLLMLDEPAAGLNPEESIALGRQIRDIRDSYDTTILLIEHDMKLVMGVCDTIVVLDHGVKIAEGAPKEIQVDPVVRRAYLGLEE